MTWVLVERGSREIRLTRERPSSPPSDEASRIRAEGILTALLSAPGAARAFARAAHAEGLTLPVDPRQVAGLVHRGTLRVVESRRAPFPVGTGGEREEREDQPAPRAETASISYQVVDDATGEPIRGVALLVRLPDGEEHERRTDGDGFVRFEGIRPGPCAVRAERGDRDLLHVLVFDGFGAPTPGTAATGEAQPWERPRVAALPRKDLRSPDPERRPALTAVRRHRVRTGDTLGSVARQHGLEEQALVRFNFGTTDEAEVQRLLAREVGCRTVDFATGAYVLTDADRPGLLYVPVPFVAEGQRTDNDYVLRVHRVRPAPAPWVFSL